MERKRNRVELEIYKFGRLDFIFRSDCIQMIGVLENEASRYIRNKKSVENESVYSTKLNIYDSKELIKR